jgi:hypothetical protein
MGGDQRRPGAARLLERDVDPVVDPHELPAADRDRVRCAEWVEVVVGQLEAGNEQEVVLASGALRLGRELPQVLGVFRSVEPTGRRIGCQPRVVAARNVVGDAEDVEAGASVEVDELADAQGAVAPVRMRVELAEQWPDFPTHPVRSVRPVCPSVVARLVTIRSRSGERGSPPTLHV